MKFSTYSILAFLLLLFSCKTPYHARKTETLNFAIKDSIQTDSISPIKAYLKPFHDSIEKQMNAVIGQAMGDFEKKKPNGSLGNLVVDAMYLKALTVDSSVFGAITNFGGIRIPEIKKGPITLGKVYEMLPFENELVIVEVKGSDLEKWMNLIAESGGWPVQFLFPIRFKQNKLLTTWDEMETDISIPFNTISKNSSYNIEANKIYKIATNDYVANGGDNCDFLKNCNKHSTGFTIRDLMIAQVKQSKQLFPNQLVGNILPTLDKKYTDIEKRLLFEK